MTENCDVPRPTNLKQTLDLFGSLSQNAISLKYLVGTALQERVRDALCLEDAPYSVAYKESTPISQNFYEVLSALEALRKSILGTSDQIEYGVYSYLKASVDTSCAYLCADRIVGILPHLYVTLEFLYFKVHSLKSGLGGSGWRSQRCDGQGDSGQGSTLSQWLKSHDITLFSSGSPSSEWSPTLLPGGYSGGGLQSTTGETLESLLDKLLSGSGSDDGGSLHNLMLDVAIITPWSPCNSATCVAAVRGLFEKLEAKFEEHIKSYPEVVGPCKSVSSQITALAPDDDASKANAFLTALFIGAPFAYSQRLETNAFYSYMKWLNPTLDKLIASLTALSRDCENWSQEGLQTATISGPFGYGFSFSEKWNTWKDDVAKNEIPNAITKLTADLTKLQTLLQKYFPTIDPSVPSSSTASAVGGILGTAAVGGVGAAFAFNVGGVTSLVRGALGILK